MDPANNNGELLTRRRVQVPESRSPEFPAKGNPQPEELEKKLPLADPAADLPLPVKADLSARFRELNRLLERERASAESAISGREYFLEQLRSNLRELESISDELEELSASGLRSDRERKSLLEKLFLRFCRVSGTIAGLGEHEHISAVSDSSAIPKSFGTLFFENLPRLIGTVIGAGIIALTVAAVFCR